MGVRVFAVRKTLFRCGHNDRPLAQQLCTLYYPAFSAHVPTVARYFYSMFPFTDTQTSRSWRTSSSVRVVSHNFPESNAWRFGLSKSFSRRVRPASTSTVQHFREALRLASTST